MKLAYQAIDRSGQHVQDVVEAIDMFDATDKLHRQGLQVTHISQASSGKASAGVDWLKTLGLKREKGGNFKTLSVFTRQLFMLISTGTPVADALTALSKQIKEPRWQRVLNAVRQQVEEGDNLANALRQHPRYFDHVYCSLVAAGESSGQLAAMLDRLSNLTQQQARIRASISGAMVYPCMLITVAAIVLLVMLVVVLPRFADMFEDMGMPLPPSTQAVIFLSDMLLGYWWAILPMMVVLFLAMRAATQTSEFKQRWDTFILRVPRLGLVVRSFITARIARVMGVLLESHLPLMEVLHLVRQSIQHSHYAKLMENAEEAVSRGEPISNAFDNARLIDSTFHEALRSGEQSGRIGFVLLHMADFMDEENDVTLRTLTSIIEPAILIVLGLIVGFLAVTMFLPLFDMTAMASGGMG